MRKTRLIGFALTFLFLGLVLWKTDLSELWSALRSANYIYVIPAALCTATSYLLRTVRWQHILAPTKRIRFGALFSVLMIGFMANNLLPARLGEFVRAFVLGRKESISKSLSFATIMLERLLDGVTLLAVLGCLALLMPLPLWGQELAYIAAGVFLIATIGIVALLFREDLAKAVVALVLRPLPLRIADKLRAKTDSFIQGLHALRGGRAVTEIIALSVAVWTVEATFYYFVMTAFGINLPGSTLVLASLMLLVVVNLGIMIPSAPGYVGTFQFFGVLALGVFGVQRELALSATIVAHGIQYGLVTSVGLICFGRENLSFQSLTKGLDADDSEEPSTDGRVGVA